MIDDPLIKGFAPKLFNEHVVNMGVLSSFIVSVSGSNDCKNLFDL